ncbi:MAG: AMP-binding protein [Actinobacteria bacterium]|nr:AMP-binding protein [Actinomycetota bacterium]
MLADLLRQRLGTEHEDLAFAVDGAGSLTYSAWDRRSSALARGLAERGVTRGDRVVLVFEGRHWLDYALAYAAVYKAAAVAVPLAGHLPPLQVGRVVDHCGATGILTAANDVLPSPRRSPAWIAGIDELETGQDGGELPRLPTLDVPELSYRPRPLQRLRPVHHASGQIAADLATYRVPGGSSSAGPLVHSDAVGSEAAREAMWLPLLSIWRPIITLPTFDPERLCALTAEHAVSGWRLLPAAVRWALDCGALDRHDLSSLRLVVLGSGPTPPGLLARLADRLPQAAIVSVRTASGDAQVRQAFRYDRGHPGALGRPVTPHLVRVTGDGRPTGLADGEVGEVRLRNPAPERGGATSWLATGERGYLDEGCLYLVASSDVVRGPGPTTSEDEVRAVLRCQAGVDGDAGRGIGADPGDRLSAATVVAPPWMGPRTEAEETVTAIWERVLGREGIGVDDHFLELGGDPMAAVKVGALVEDAFDVWLEPAEILQGGTVAGLARLVEHRNRSVDDVGETTAPLASSQEGMLWHEQFAPGSQNLPPLSRRFRGPLDVAALGQALELIVRHHEPLRTTFELRRLRPVQVVAPAAAVRLERRDLSGLAPGDQESELTELLADLSRPFDLVAGPLFEASLVRLGPDDHVLALRVHHSVYDDWSVGVFRRELSRLYRELAGGAHPSPGDRSRRFTDFSRGQRRRLAGSAGTAELSWWKGVLAGAPLALELAVDDPDRPLGSPQSSPEPVSVVLPGELVAGLRALARRERTTLFMTVLAGFQVLLHACTGQRDLLLASVVANRNRSELEGMIGCFTKKVLLRLSGAGDPPFVELLSRVRATVLGALAHQDLPFETVLQSTLGRPAADHGLVPHPVVMFQGVTPHDEEMVLPDVDSSGLGTSVTARRAHFASSSRGGGAERRERPWGGGLYRGTFLILSVVESSSGLSLVARGAFHRPAVERLLAGFVALLAGVVASPSSSLSALSELAGRSEDARSRHQAGTVDLRGFPVQPERIEAALAHHPSVAEATVGVTMEASDGLRLVASAVPTGDRSFVPSEARTWLWTQLPGYALPATVVTPAERQTPGDPSRGWPPEAMFLASLWAEVLGIDGVDPEEHYWQSFSFLEAVERARDAGLAVTNQQVARNRTVANLATDVAAARDT